MTGGTLIVTRKISRYQDFVRKFSAFGFPNVSVTSLDIDALYFLIDELKPSLILMDAMFYTAGTPYMIRVLLKQKRFRNLNIVVFAVDQYPADLGMMFIINGAKSYVDINDGENQYEKGLLSVRNGEKYVSPSVQKSFELCSIFPALARILTERQIIVLMLTCCGFDCKEIADKLCISEKTVNNHNSEIHRSLGSKKPHELIIIAEKLGLFTLKDLIFIKMKYDTRINENNITKSKNKKKKKAA